MTTLDRDRIETTPHTVRHGSARRRTRWRKARLATQLAIVGPGLLVMVGDNDAGGVAILLVVNAIQLGNP